MSNTQLQIMLHKLKYDSCHKASVTGILETRMFISSVGIDIIQQMVRFKGETTARTAVTERII